MRKTALPLIVAACAVTVLVALAAVAADSPNLWDALQAQRALAGENPNDPQVLNDLGNLLLLAGEPEEAEEAYRRALEIAPEMPSARYNLGLLLYQTERPKEALAEFQAVADVDPDNAWALYQIGAAHDLLGAETKAVNFYARAFRLDPQLAFPEVNPHVIDNEHVTSAMLRAYRDLPLAGQAPKSYEQAGRIVNLMVPATEEVPAAEAEETPVTPEDLEGLRPRPSFAPGEADAQEEGARQPGRDGSGTTLRQEDLEEGESLNQTVTPGTPQRAQPRGGQRVQPRGGQRVQPNQRPPARQPEADGRSEGGEAPERDSGARGQQPEGRERFVPGLPSTGRLELELIPGGGGDEPAPAG